MAMHAKRIPNSEVTPVVQTDIFDGQQANKSFALVSLGFGKKDNPLYQAYLKLRANVYANQTGMIPETNLTDEGYDLNENDERSSAFLILQNRQLGRAAAVACVCGIEKNQNHPNNLPVEDMFNVEIGQSGLEVSRFLSRLDDRRQQGRAVVELVRSAAARIHKGDYAQGACAVVEPPLEERLQKIGVSLDRIAEPKFTPEYADINLAVRLNLEPTAKSLDPRGLLALEELNIEPDSVRYWD